MRKLVPILLLILAMAGCSGSPETGQKTDPPPAGGPALSSSHSSAAAYSLVFFLDPNGGPCQMQNAILNDMADELKGVATVRYVRTTVPEDLNTFYSFGIRGLPTLLLADASGREVRRLPPGVKSAAEIRELLRVASGK